MGLYFSAPEKTFLDSRIDFREDLDLLSPFLRGSFEWRPHSHFDYWEERVRALRWSIALTAV